VGVEVGPGKVRMVAATWDDAGRFGHALWREAHRNPSLRDSASALRKLYFDAYFDAVNELRHTLGIEVHVPSESGRQVPKSLHAIDDLTYVMRELAEGSPTSALAKSWAS
jgi:hypothetical protein